MKYPYADKIEAIYKQIFKTEEETEAQWQVKYNYFLEKGVVNLDLIHASINLQVSVGMTTSEEYLQELKKRILLKVILDEDDNNTMAG